MCGRYGLTAQAEDYVEMFPFELHANRNEELYQPRYDIRPTQTVPVIVYNNNAYVVKNIRWGYHPQWAKFTIINSRSENLTEKPYLKKAALTQRCIIPASFFYEWQQIEKNKIPWIIQPARARLFAIAGLIFTQTEKEKQIEVCSILTAAANPLMRKIHNHGKSPFRQPAILNSDAVLQWLDPNSNKEDALKNFSFEYSEKEMKASPLSHIGNDETHTPPQTGEIIENHKQ